MADADVPCVGCKLGYQGEFCIACDECEVWFHGKCVNVAENRTPETWFCPRCVADQKAAKAREAKQSLGRGSTMVGTAAEGLAFIAQTGGLMPGNTLRRQPTIINNKVVEDISCVGCQIGYQGEFMLTCDKCGVWFHGSCVRVPEEAAPAKWYCPKAACRQLERSNTGMIREGLEFIADSGGLGRKRPHDEDAQDEPPAKKAKSATVAFQTEAVSAPASAPASGSEIPRGGTMIGTAAEGLAFIAQTGGLSGTRLRRQPTIVNNEVLEDISCVGCNLGYQGQFMIACTKCDVWYHGTCVNVPEEATPGDKWYCSKPECRKLERTTTMMAREGAEFIAHSGGLGARRAQDAPVPVASEPPIQQQQTTPATSITTDLSRSGTMVDTAAEGLAFIANAGGLSRPLRRQPTIVNNAVVEDISCTGCQIGYQGQFMLTCDKCDVWYHGTCVNVPEEAAPEKWYCPKDECRKLERSNTMMIREGVEFIANQGGLAYRG